MQCLLQHVSTWSMNFTRQQIHEQKKENEHFSQLSITWTKKMMEFKYTYNMCTILFYFFVFQYVCNHFLSIHLSHANDSSKYKRMFIDLSLLSCCYLNLLYHVHNDTLKKSRKKKTNSSKQNKFKLILTGIICMRCLQTGFSRAAIFCGSFFRSFHKLRLF